MDDCYGFLQAYEQAAWQAPATTYFSCHHYCVGYNLDDWWFNHKITCWLSITWFTTLAVWVLWSVISCQFVGPASNNDSFSFDDFFPKLPWAEEQQLLIVLASHRKRNCQIHLSWTYGTPWAEQQIHRKNYFPVHMWHLCNMCLWWAGTCCCLSSSIKNKKGWSLDWQHSV